ncbi:MAG: DUF3794 domain-containing protein [Lawsonibacter sp.]|jgi:hypothetical protein
MTMELEFDRDTLTCCETILDMTLCQEETLESIVPDACPDILRIVDVCGQATLNGKQAGDGTAVVTGMVRAAVLYQPEGATGLRRMELGLPFTCQADAPGLTGDGVVLASPHLRSAEARALNPRKVLLRVDLAVDITACQPKERSVCRGVSGEEECALCQRQLHEETYQLDCVLEKPFTFTEQIRPQSNQGQLPEVLSVRAQPLCTESKLIGSKLIFKGTAEVYLLLQEMDGTLTSMHESLPFSQIMEVSKAGEDADCHLAIELTDLHCQADPGDGRSWEISLELLAQAMVYGRRAVTLLQDLYSTKWQMEAENQVLPLCRLGDQGVRPQMVRELLETGEMVRSIVDSRMSCGQLTQSREGKQLVLTAEAWITVLYLDEEDQIQAVRRMLPVVCRLDCPAEYQCRCTCVNTGELFAAPGAGGIEVRFNVEFHYQTSNIASVPFIEQASLGEARTWGEGRKPSIVLRLAAPGEGAWEIAKLYGTTTEQILQANELEGEELPEGKMLLIPGIR